MSKDVELITDIWSAIKPYLNPKEKFDAALQLVEVFDDHGLTESFEEEHVSDRSLQKALNEYFGLDEKEDD